MKTTKEKLAEYRVVVHQPESMGYHIGIPKDEALALLDDIDTLEALLREVLPHVHHSADLIERIEAALGEKEAADE